MYFQKRYNCKITAPLSRTCTPLVSVCVVGLHYGCAVWALKGHFLLEKNTAGFVTVVSHSFLALCVLFFKVFYLYCFVLNACDVLECPH